MERPLQFVPFIPLSDEAIRQGLKALVAKGYLRWTDPDRTIDQYGPDEPLAVELTDKPFPGESEVPVVQVTREEQEELLRLFGVNDRAHVEGANDRIVRISPRSDVSCPAHGIELRPDACRSCRFLAGEVRAS